MELFFELFGEILLAWLMPWMLYLVIVPVACVVLTPVVLIDAYFGPGSYGGKVWIGYRELCWNIADRTIDTR